MAGFRSRTTGLGRPLALAAGHPEVRLVAFHLERMAPAAGALATRLDDWHTLTQLTPGQAAMIGLIAAYMACIAFVG